MSITTGRYTNPEDVISKALKLLLEWDKDYQNWVEETREKVDIAIEQLDTALPGVMRYTSSGQDARTTRAS